MQVLGRVVAMQNFRLAILTQELDVTAPDIGKRSAMEQGHDGEHRDQSIFNVMQQRSTFEAAYQAFLRRDS